MRTVEVHKFKKGQKLRLDDIYWIQALGRDWWNYYHPVKAGDAPGEDVVITKTIKFTIIIEETK